MVELKGSLANASLLSVVQSIGEQRRTGTLHLTHDPATGRLAFDGGRLVGAGCGDEHGLQAVAHCVLDFEGGDYKFDEGAPTIERTLDLGPADVTKLITRIGSRDFGKVHGEPEVDHPSPSSPCPLLGFADDREHHYSRSTAMHRCYAGGAASLVSAQEQRDLCLSGRFSTCPRFRTDEATILTAAPVVVAAAPEPAVRPVPLRAVAARAAPPPMPPGVAARLAAASQMQMSSSAAPAPRMSPNPEPLGPDLARGPVAVAPNGAAHEPELDRSNGSGPSVD
ncbi:MAG: DUF4388 domain-containing protein, partial [Chloroflexi bacterium]|nr:DUF4388 domain-containing protein [Chloroflexota bacterium]